MITTAEKLARLYLLSDSLSVTSDILGPEVAMSILLVTSVTIGVVGTIGIIIGTFQVFGLA